MRLHPSIPPRLPPLPTSRTHASQKHLADRYMASVLDPTDDSRQTSSSPSSPSSANVELLTSLSHGRQYLSCWLPAADLARQDTHDDARNGRSHGAHGAPNGTANGTANGAVNGAVNGAANGMAHSATCCAGNGTAHGVANGAPSASPNGTVHGAASSADHRELLLGTCDGRDPFPRFPRRGEVASRPRLAIALLIRGAPPLCVAGWCAYHLAIGFERLYMCAAHSRTRSLSP
jgi:hypothetical protein